MNYLAQHMTLRQVLMLRWPLMLVLAPVSGQLVPVSHPVLTLSSAKDLNFEGAKVTLHCEAQRGSLPIVYQFQHEDVTLGSRWAHSAGGVAISFSPTAEHSGNYYCTADNGFGPQRSEVSLCPSPRSWLSHHPLHQAGATSPWSEGFQGPQMT
nr:Fc receptor-like protein 5 isoform X1 [Gorilla gorilla gorilla]